MEDGRAWKMENSRFKFLSSTCKGSTMRLKCPKCQKALKVADEMVGRRGKCPGCGQVLLVPSVPQQAPKPTAQRNTISSPQSAAEWLSQLSSRSIPVEERLKIAYDFRKYCDQVEEQLRQLLVEDVDLRNAILARFTYEHRTQMDRLIWSIDEAAIVAGKMAAQRSQATQRPPATDSLTKPNDESESAPAKPTEEKTDARIESASLDCATSGNQGALVHSWPTENESWHDATYADKWPVCKMCGVSLLTFIDGQDIPKDATFHTKLLARHRKLTEQINSLPEKCWPAFSRLQVDPSCPLAPVPHLDNRPFAIKAE